ncbi:hypothetical protein VE04_01076 [Pseudogymnoascus sp. 24MN13]|nr:hypothetical protein VE04_01076 [Pseudogymnoascus sp. 24MN13]
MEVLESQDLSDGQIQQMLRDAEQRMRASAEASANTLITTSGISSLPGLDSSTSISNGTGSGLPSVYVKPTISGAQVDPEFLVSKQERKLANTPRCVEDPVAAKVKAAKEKAASAGPNWYNLPKTVLTPELKRDLQLLRLRSVLDPKRHYKKDNDRKSDVPEFSQVGTVIEGPTEFFTARMTNKERKRTFLEDVLAGEQKTQRFKSKYTQIQLAKTSGKKAHYKALRAKRSGKVSKG